MRTLLIVLFLTTGSILCAQKASTWIESGDRAMEESEFYTAAQRYQEAWLLDSSSFDLTVKYAEALRLSKQYRGAERLYEKAYEKDQGRIFEKGLFWLAAMQKLNGNYREALRNYKRYLRGIRREKDSYEYKKSEKEIESILFAMNARSDSGEVEINHVSQPVNTQDAEFSPYPGPDSLLYFSRIATGDLDDDEQALSKIYSAQKAFEKIDNPELLDNAINTAGMHQANLTFTPDETRVYFSRCSDLSQCRIFTAGKKGDAWQEIEALDEINLEGYTSTMPHYTSVNGVNVLFFASNRPGSQGKMDIWYSEEKNGKFAKPKNAGSSVNSIDNEISPFFLGEYLYFSSDWHGGFGGYDIFKARGEPGNFGNPENLGIPINSRVNDLSYSYSSDWQAGFLVSNRPGSFHNKGETCCTDIYSITYNDSTQVDTSEYASLDELNAFLPITLYFHNDRPNPATRDTTTELTYLETYRDYIGRKENYLKQVAGKASGEEKEERVYEMEEFFSLRVEKGMDDLNTFTELLLQELEEGREVELAVKGFASPRAKSDYNERLTKRRINSMVNYLRAFDEGVFLPYFADTAASGGSIEIIQIPFGESQAAAEVSDELQDEEGSIYSVGASMERKIEIISIQRDENKEESPDIGKIELGEVPAQENIPFHYFLKNDSAKTMKIDSVIISCDCISGVLPTDTIAANDSLRFPFSFNSEGYLGEVEREIQFFLNGAKEPLTIKVHALVRREE